MRRREEGSVESHGLPPFPGWVIHFLVFKSNKWSLLLSEQFQWNGCCIENGGLPCEMKADRRLMVVILKRVRYKKAWTLVWRQRVPGGLVRLKAGCLFGLRREHLYKNQAVWAKLGRNDVMIPRYNIICRQYRWIRRLIEGCRRSKCICHNGLFIYWQT